MTGPQDPLQLDDQRHALGRPDNRAELKREFSDFRVDEELGFEPSGQGEHLYLWLRKCDLSTTELARRLSESSGVPLRDIGYAGMKDRRGICRQWFSLRLPGTDEPELTTLEDSQVAIEGRARNHRKLRVGSHRGNRFQLLLRDCRGERADWESRLHSLSAQGMPNYFGAQRFGRDLDNLQQLRDYFAAGRPRTGRRRRSMLLSAGRAFLFNRVLSARIADESWNSYLEGDVLSLDGSASCFTVNPGAWDETLQARLLAQDIHISGPLYGRTEQGDRYTSRAQAADMEKAVLKEFPDLLDGLEAAGLTAARRPLRSRVLDLQWHWRDEHSLELSFGLNRGSYATSLLRELCIIEHVTKEEEDRPDEGSRVET